MIQYIIGIDPGQTGAVCMLDIESQIHMLTNFEVENGFIKYKPLDLELMPVFIEKPFLLPKQRGHEVVWRNYQTLFLAFNSLNLKEIRPQEWKKILGIPKGLSKKESLEYQFMHFCNNAKKVDSDFINWYGTTKKGNQSTILDSGKIDAYCIALAGLKMLKIDDK